MGVQNGGSVAPVLVELSDLLHPLEVQLSQLLEAHEQQKFDTARTESLPVPTEDELGLESSEQTTESVST